MKVFKILLNDGNHIDVKADEVNPDNAEKAYIFSQKGVGHVGRVIN